MKKEINILQIGMSDNQGGIETYIYNLYKNSNKEEFKFDFIDISENKIAFYDELEELGAKIYKVVPRTKNYLRHVKELKKIIKNNNYDVIHIHIMDYSWFEPIIIANKDSNAKLILHSHSASSPNIWGKKHWLLHKIGKRLCKKAKVNYVACGEKAGQFMFGDKQFKVFNNGIDIDKFKFDENNRKKIRNRLNIKEDTVVIGQVAKLEEQKNPLFLLEIFKKYNEYNNDSKLIIVGEGSLRNKIEAKIKKDKIEDSVILFGKRNDSYKFYSAFDIFVMPSLYEGLSIALIEAQVNGLKCYTSDGVDKNSNITGNVEFLSLEKGANFWADNFFNKNNSRDRNIINKIPEEFKSQKSYEEVYKFYKKIQSL